MVFLRGVGLPPVRDDDLPMKSFLPCVFLLTLLLAAFAAVAEVVRVPQDAPTIQEGLNTIQDGDTILVALGVYAEALVAPPLHFTLKGDVVPDTGEYPRPIIDPSSLPGSDTLSCLDLSPQAPGPVIEDMMFRNGAHMY